MHKKTNGILLMIIAALFFSVMGALTKHATARLPFMEAVFFRAFVSLVLITPWMLTKKIPFIGKNNKVLLVRSFSGFTALALNFYVLTKITLADTSLLSNTSVPFVALLSIFLLGEAKSTPLFIYIFCGLIGATLIIKPSFHVANVPGLLGLTSGLFAAIAYIGIKKLHQTESFFTIVFYFSFFSSLLAFIMMIPNFIWPTSLEWVSVIGIGLCGTVAQLCMTYSYKFIDASVVSPYSYFGVIFSALWGLLFWKEIPDLLSILGALLIISCGIGIMKMKPREITDQLE
ncbi:MAG: hypothetical protein A2048_08970 [Deltaproteobacteria bacterium GWA2_45_12]|nr:MAG: hypothetical protein A2048_08970 [Deltaproteobacteria bacterium GWA2_45_12]